MTKKPVPLLGMAELAYSVFALAWFFLPLLQFGPTSLVPLHLASQVFPDIAAAPVRFALISVMVWIIPLIALWKIVAFFLVEKLPFAADPHKWPSVLLNMTISFFVMATHVLHALVFAKGTSYFLTLSPLMLTMLVLSIAWNAWGTIRLINVLSSNDEAWKQYRDFRTKVETTKQNVWSRILRWGIQRRLVVSFVTIIFLIIIILCGVLLNDFSSTLRQAVIQNGQTLAERTASVIKTSLGDSIAIEDYLSIEQKKNQAGTFPFNSLSFYKRDPNSKAYFVSASTDQSLVDQHLKSTDQDSTTMTGYRELAGGSLIEFNSPIILSNITLGYVSAVYQTEVIFEPYFRTQTKVFIIASIFIYLSIFITYLFGRNIVIPILFLRMSVNRISLILGQMIRGDRRIITEELQYRDFIQTRDEIKGLSLEIGNMTSVIRGVLPYISASTLKHAERENPTTEKRDLAFLFTDIRGFTTLCEGLEPDEVVTLLNYYLELQSSVILENGGDIDKFVGDEIMAMFEGPGKELNAARAAMGIAAAMEKEREKAEAAKANVISIGIGINSGPVVFGSVGARDRMDFTSIGDTVNLAARLEGANKTYGTKTLIAESVYTQVKDNLICREIDLMTVKGKSKPVRIYEIMGERSKADTKALEICDRFSKGLAAYRAQDWKKAGKIFTANFMDLGDETSKIFVERVALFSTTTMPADWDGVFNLSVK